MFRLPGGNYCESTELCVLRTRTPVFLDQLVISTHPYRYRPSAMLNKAAFPPGRELTGWRRTVERPDPRRSSSRRPLQINVDDCLEARPRRSRPPKSFRPPPSNLGDLSLAAKRDRNGADLNCGWNPSLEGPPIGASLFLFYARTLLLGHLISALA